MNVEDSRTERVTGSLNAIVSKQMIQPNKGKLKSSNQSCFQNVVPTRQQQANSSKPKFEDAKFDMIDLQIEMLKKLWSQKLNSIEEDYDDLEEQIDAIHKLNSDNPDVSGFFLDDNINFHLGPINHEDVRLILDWRLEVDSLRRPIVI
jgi:hypothetical protein